MEIFRTSEWLFDEEGVGAKKETAIGHFAWQRWEWMLFLNISYVAYWIKKFLITGNKNSLHCIECCWLQAQAFRPVQLYFHPWKLAADIPVSAGFICLTICFHLTQNIYFFSFSVILILNQCFLIFADL